MIGDGKNLLADLNSRWRDVIDTIEFEKLSNTTGIRWKDQRPKLKMNVLQREISSSYNPLHLQ